MFAHRTLLFFFVPLFLSILFYYSHHPQEDSLSTKSEQDASNMLTQGGFDGDFGNTWFPRCEFSGDTGGAVTGWPSKGGYYTLHCSVAELEFLGLDRFKPGKRSEDPQEEEAWCYRLRDMGANWYRDPYEEMDKEMDRQASGVEVPRLYLGWPADGGLWALQATKAESNLKGLGRINNVITMEERWQKIQEFGGTFYAEPKDCPYLNLDE